MRRNYTPCPIKVFARSHAHRGKTLLQDLQNLASAVMNRAMVRFRVMQEEGVMAFV